MRRQEPFIANSLQRLVAELAKLPGIGPRSAGRLVYHLLRGERKRIRDLADALAQVAEKVHECSVCGNFTEEDPCRICAGPERDPDVLCVVEQPFDVLMIEKAGGFRGRYHVLGGALSPINGIGPEELRVDSLMKRLPGGVKEIILATNPNVEGEATSLYLQKKLRPLGVRVTKIARGLPIGSDLEYADEVTLAQALEGRVEI